MMPDLPVCRSTSAHPWEKDQCVKILLESEFFPRFPCLSASTRLLCIVAIRNSIRFCIWADGCCFSIRMRDGWEIIGDHAIALKVKARWSAMAQRHCPCQLPCEPSDSCESTGRVAPVGQTLQEADASFHSFSRVATDSLSFLFFSRQMQLNSHCSFAGHCVRMWSRQSCSAAHPQFFCEWGDQTEILLWFASAFDCFFKAVFLLALVRAWVEVLRMQSTFMCM